MSWRSRFTRQRTRSAILVPLNRKYPISQLMDACRHYIAMTGRHVTFEYVMIKDVNDGVEQATQLAKLLRGMLCHVNLIPLNPVPESGLDAQAPRPYDDLRISSGARALG